MIILYLNTLEVLKHFVSYQDLVSVVGRDDFLQVIISTVGGSKLSHLKRINFSIFL